MRVLAALIRYLRGETGAETPPDPLLSAEIDDSELEWPDRGPDHAA